MPWVEAARTYTGPITSSDCLFKNPELTHIVYTYGHSRQLISIPSDSLGKIIE